MKILKIIHGYPPDYNAGSEVYSQSICNELSKTHDVTIFSREENDYAPDFQFRETITETGIKHIRVNMARGKDGYNHTLLNNRFKTFVELLKPDVAHIGHLNHLSIGIIDVLYKLKIPIIFTLHDFWLMCPRGQFLQRNFDGNSLYKLCDFQENQKCADSCYSMYYSGINTNIDRANWANWIGIRMSAIKEVVEKITCFHAPSRYLMNRFVSDFSISESKVFYLDYGFPTQHLNPANRESHNPFTFGYIGTHTPGKGINLLISAFNSLGENAILKIFGRANGQNTTALKKMVSPNNVNVEFMGEYRNRDLESNVFNQVDCIVVPSIWGENSPLVIHEAQACHIPVITADYGGMAEYVKHKVNGLLFTHRNASSLSQQMVYAAGNPHKMKEFGKRGYLYSNDGSVPDIVNHTLELEKIYQKLISHEI